MKSKQRLFLFVLISLFLFSTCHHKNQREKEMENAPYWFDNYSFFDEDDYYDYFQNSLNLLSNNEFDFNQLIRDYYQEQEEPIWTLNGFQEQKIDSLVSVIASAQEHGLSPQIFRYAQIQSGIKALRTNKYTNEDDLYAALSRLEWQLTQAYLLYSKCLMFGAMNPVEVNGGKWLCQTTTADDSFYNHALSAVDTSSSYLKHLQPTDSNYLAIQRELKVFIALKDSVLPSIPYLEGRVGQKVARANMIGSRLQLLGYIDSAYVPHDTLSKRLMRALNQFREDHAIPVSSRLDSETIDALNLQPAYYIDKLSANLERYRWKVTPQKGSSFIAVNIADFTLQTYCSDTLAFRTRVCCGKYPERNESIDSCLVNGLLQAQKSETPLLYSEISSIVLNPEWNVPYSILKDEYYPQLVRNNVKVIRKEKLHLLDGKTKKDIFPENVNWKKINRKNIPYRLVQSSGPHNALGKIKFNFPNPESVYLHDTNNKGAFKRRVRALSHGCVRVENPDSLMNIILRMNDYKDERMEKVHIILGDEPTTEEGIAYLEERKLKEQEYFDKLLPEDTLFYRPIRPTSLFLKKKMPIYFEYFTCFLGENGRVQYRPDIYCKEQNIRTCLKRLNK